MERFDYKGTIIFIEKDIIHEKAFTEKGWFVQKAIASGVEYDDAIAMANIWINMKFNNCTYKKDVMTRIISFAERL